MRKKCIIVYLHQTKRCRCACRPSNICSYKTILASDDGWVIYILSLQHRKCTIRIVGVRSSPTLPPVVPEQPSSAVASFTQIVDTKSPPPVGGGQIREPEVPYTCMNFLLNFRHYSSQVRDYFPHLQKSKSNTAIIAGTAAGGGVLVLVLSAMAIMYIRKRKAVAVSDDHESRHHASVHGHCDRSINDEQQKWSEAPTQDIEHEEDPIRVLETREESVKDVNSRVERINHSSGGSTVMRSSAGGGCIMPGGGIVTGPHSTGEATQDAGEEAPSHLELTITTEKMEISSAESLIKAVIFRGDDIGHGRILPPLAAASSESINNDINTQRIGSKPPLSASSAIRQSI